jgi:ATP-binding cassette subfamily B (MDR/TAP) protein 1
MEKDSVKYRSDGQGAEEQTNAFNGYLVGSPPPIAGSKANIRKRIFQYGSSKVYTMQGIATACALGSGVGMALVNLVFGQFITVITDYTSGRIDPARFRGEAGRLRYVPCVQSRSAEETNIKIVSTFLSLAFADSF